jgi:integrase
MNHAETVSTTGAPRAIPGAAPSASPTTTSSTTAPKRTRRLGVSADLRVIAPREGLPLTLRELIALRQAENPTAHADSTMRMRKWLDDFQLGDLPAWGITREQIEAGSRIMVQQGYAISTANRDVGELGMLYRWAAKKEFTPDGFNSPTITIARDPEPMRVIEPARPGEWEQLRRLAKGFQDPKFTLFVWLLMDTGARRSEIGERTWADFDLDAEEGPNLVLKAEDTKTDKPRRLYFSHETAQLLRRLRPVERYRGCLVFVSPRGTGPNKYRKPWARLTELLGRPDLRVHDLRHMVAAELLKQRKGMSQVAQMLGHSSLVLHRRYGHLDDSAVRDMQADRLGLENERPLGWKEVDEAKVRHAERVANAPADAYAEAQRLQLVAQEAMAAAMAAAQALAGMRNPNVAPTLRAGVQA